jgi:hypothetical protein
VAVYPSAAQLKRSGNGAGATLDPGELHTPPAGTAVGAQYRAARAAQAAQNEGVAGGAVAEHRPEQQQPMAGYVSARSWD